MGKNLTYLSQLDGLTFELYAGSVLPRLLEQVTSCKDELAQQYLMQVGGGWRGARACLLSMWPRRRTPH